jgi:hypothetical protein
MDVIRAKSLKDSIILGLVFAGSFFLANTLNQTALIVYQENFSSENKIKDWIIYAGLVVTFYIFFIYILRYSY